MSPKLAFGIAVVHLLLLSVVNCNYHGFLLPPKFFDVTNYGAVANGETDNSQAFLRAWKDACKYPGKSRVYIPRGTYLVETASFHGPCRGPIAFVIRGILRATTNPAKFVTNTWIAFRYIDRLTVAGGGYLDGQGSSAWKYNDCQTNPKCLPLPASLRFDFITNSRVHHLKSYNSKNLHINLFACTNVNISNIRISAPWDSPNTDGIHIGASNNIRISRAIIRTGDDCIAMVSGSRDIDISEVACGPGHGISIGSLGRTSDEERVSGIHVRNCTFTGTDNGVRIKTWGGYPTHITASDISFQDIVMNNVQNPIIIDQQYCPIASCLSGESAVQIRNVMFRNIWGISTTKVAVSIVCSRSRPCKNVKLIDIGLAYRGSGPALAVCTNVQGSAYGKQFPHGCL